VTLRFGIHSEPSGSGAGPAEAVARLDTVLDAMPPDVLRAAWAHMSLRMVDWAIRHLTSDAVEHWADLAEQRAL
jgi:hypothetical protein